MPERCGLLGFASVRLDLKFCPYAGHWGRTSCPAGDRVRPAEGLSFSGKAIGGRWVVPAERDPPIDKSELVFPPSSETWRVNRHANGLLFGPAAVLLQVAHPRIAQGVADHSDFRGNALGRLRRTLASVNRIAFGTRAEAEEMRRHLARVHGRVQGATSPGMVGSERYSAFEPDLMMWVLATLIDASIKGYELVWGELSHERRVTFYREFRHFGSYFGLSEDEGPADYDEFEKYYAEQLRDEVLASHPLCAEVAAAVVRPKSPPRDRLLGVAMDFLAIETVPEPVRTRLGLQSTWWTRARMALLRGSAPAAFRILPRRLTYYPESYRAERALRASGDVGRN